MKVMEVFVEDAFYSMGVEVGKDKAIFFPKLIQMLNDPGQNKSNGSIHREEGTGSLLIIG